jgi:hypothetical protein
MTTLKLHESPTPSQAVVAGDAKTVEVTDARGRTFTLKRPNLLQQFRFVAALRELAENATYRAMATPLIFVTAIDSEAQPMPTTQLQIDAMIQRIDTDGFDAIMTGIRENFSQEVVTDSAVKK